MKLATRILAALSVIIGGGFYFLTYGVLDTVRIRYLEGVEETMVDHSRILASFVSFEMEHDSFSPKALHDKFDNTYDETFASTIYQLKKTTVDTRVYITDASGIIIFDSARKDPPGTDYSRWRDVYLTLRGHYGARSSREAPETQASSVLYVGAPLIVHGKIAGVLTVAKPTTSINNFILFARTQIIRKSIVVVLLVSVSCILLITFITGPIKRLTRYANAVTEGKKVNLPSLDNSEIGAMGRAFENMREALENRRYVESYVQTLTHEIKSPVSAIRGAAELLEEAMPENQRKTFIKNIRSESDRIQMLIDRMLQLSSIETRNTLDNTETGRVNTLIEDVMKWLKPQADTKQILLKTDSPENHEIRCEPFLLKQALSNLIQNSIDFSSSGDIITVSTFKTDSSLNIRVTDQGPGIPDFALEKIYDRFFSLQRPDSGKKSTGLGLNFVREIAELHNGEILIESKINYGVSATLSIPVKPTAGSDSS